MHAWESMWIDEMRKSSFVWLKLISFLYIHLHTIFFRRRNLTIEYWKIFIYNFHPKKITEFWNFKPSSENKANESKTEADCFLNTNFPFFSSIFPQLTHMSILTEEGKAFNREKSSQEDVNREYVCAHKMQSSNSAFELFFLRYQLVDAEDWNEIRKRQQKKIPSLNFQTIFFIFSFSEQTFMLIGSTWLDFFFFYSRYSSPFFSVKQFPPFFAHENRMIGFMHATTIDEFLYFYLNKLHRDVLSVWSQRKFFGGQNFQFIHSVFP